MNSRTKFFALIIFMLGAMVANAVPLKTTVIADATAGIYKLIYRTAEAGKVKVSIYNADGDLVFTETLAHVESFTHLYNFSNLSQGEYSTIVEDKKEKTNKK